MNKRPSYSVYSRDVYNLPTLVRGKQRRGEVRAEEKWDVGCGFRGVRDKEEEMDNYIDKRGSGNCGYGFAVNWGWVGT
ncbi:unnamed protein product [Dovyalis caffra]|uniref:Uncharacterized protein n=1 Tax=Dovyalis caffra TaxID=77055 RepID=A0AAV1QVL8_9ROSI|nr:unnamed protein product [Dovyalis caffra]